jgi:hypothetical protein
MLMVGITTDAVSGASVILLSIIILVRFLIKSPLTELALGEFLYTITFGVIRLDYASLLGKSGLSPTRFDGVLIGLQKLLLLAFACGLVLIGGGFIANVSW